MPGKILIHLPRHMLAEIADGRPHFYNHVLGALEGMGAEVAQVTRAPGNPAPDPDDGDFHLVHQGSHRQQNALNTGMAYVAPFWYADPLGIYGESSLFRAEFDPAEVDPGAAQRFFTRTHRRLALARRSRYEQKATRTGFPPGVVGVFLQGESDFTRRAAHLEEREMIEGALASGAGPVVVKPHPLGSDPALAMWLEDQVKAGRLTITDANVHDILARACVTLSISSAVALEGMLHRVPAVLCGRSDLRHCAVTAHRGADVAEAIDTARAGSWPFAAFLYWFLALNMLNTGADDFTDRLRGRIAPRLENPASFGLA